MATIKTIFFDSGPALELLFTGNGGREVAEALEVDEVLDVVTGGEAIGKGFVLVLEDANFELRRDTDVEMFEATGEDIDVRDFVHEAEYDSYEILREGKSEVQGIDGYRGVSWFAPLEKYRGLSAPAHDEAVRLRSR